MVEPEEADDHGRRPIQILMMNMLRILQFHDDVRKAQPHRHCGPGRQVTFAMTSPETALAPGEQHWPEVLGPRGFPFAGGIRVVGP
jgi:hypothetical protein